MIRGYQRILSYSVFSRSHYWGKPSSGSTPTKTNTIHGNQQPRQGNYQGNNQGNNFNNNFSPLRELVASQSKLLDQMTRKLVSNDKTLENIHTKMDTFASVIKNQHSFNKMLESQLAPLAAVVPPLQKGKILGQPEDLETANLVDIHNATQCYIESADVYIVD